jgi:hypothetical protein
MFALSGRMKATGHEIGFMLNNDAGTVAGDDVFIERLATEVRVRDGQRVGLPEGPFTQTNHLSSEVSTYLIARDLLIPGTITVHTSPHIPTQPKGAN